MKEANVEEKDRLKTKCFSRWQNISTVYLATWLCTICVELPWLLLIWVK